MSPAPKGSVKIITDSAADLTDDIASEAGIGIVPLSIRFDTDEYLDGSELSREAFWEKLTHVNDLPATSAPSPGRFEEAFRTAKADGYQAVVCLTISSKISGTYQIAVNAAQSVGSDIAVHVIDTQACTIAQRTLCLEAAKLASTGSDAASIVDHIDRLKTSVYVYGALDTLENLKKGGRIGAAGAFFGSLLNVKPIVGLVDGEVKAVARARTHGKAVDHLLDVLKESLPVQNVVVGHSGAADVTDFAARVAEIAGQPDVPVTLIGPVVGTHTGPRLLALSFTTQATA